MGTKLAVGSVKTLYDYWGETITDKLKADLTSQQSGDQAKKLPVETAVKLSKTKRKKGEEEELGEGSVTTGAGVGVQLLVNLASQEYFKSVRTKSLSLCGVRVVECVFKDKGRVTSVYAKRARGLMARYIVTQGILGPGSGPGSSGSSAGTVQYNTVQYIADSWRLFVHQTIESIRNSLLYRTGSVFSSFGVISAVYY